jgi:hypothetical protein
MGVCHCLLASSAVAPTCAHHCLQASSGTLLMIAEAHE